jgi:hypothetical protein
VPGKAEGREQKAEAWRNFCLLLSAFWLWFVAGCASGTQARSFDAQVYEQRGRYVARNVNGEHLFVVRITNRSQEAIVVDSVELDSQTTSLQFYQNAVAVDDTLQPGETRDLNMVISVNAVSLNYITSIDSIDVSITARSASRGEFTETKGCTVIPQ